MLRYFVLFGLLLPLATAQITTTTHAEQVKENTSACSAADVNSGLCYQAFQRMTDVAGFAPKPGGGQYTALTPYFNPAATNVSGPVGGNTRSLSVRRLLPPNLANTNVPVFVHYMPWFFQGSSEHVSPGYESDRADVILEHLRDIGARDFDGVIIDWNGLAKPREDLATARLREHIAGKTNLRNQPTEVCSDAGSRHVCRLGKLRRRSAQPAGHLCPRQD